MGKRVTVSDVLLIVQALAQKVEKMQELLKYYHIVEKTPKQKEEERVRFTPSVNWSMSSDHYKKDSIFYGPSTLPTPITEKTREDEEEV